jgi:hypothetical protein
VEVVVWVKVFAVRSGPRDLTRPHTWLHVHVDLYIHVGLHGCDCLSSITAVVFALLQSVY